MNSPARQDTHTNGVNLPSETHTHRTGHGTQVEQTRAAAEVQAAVYVAQQWPRDVAKALSAMRQSCAQPALAERAFFRYPRGGQNITGPSVFLARELARCWGNIQYGVSELRRDDDYGQSEMQAWAWDVETNARTATVFISPHKRDKKSGPEKVVDMRDVYELNSNNGARRVRECIFNVLPGWYVEEAKTLCSQTIESGGSNGKTLPQRIADSITAFENLGISQDQLETKLGQPSAKWTAHDVAQLGVIYQSVQRGEVTKDDEFPPQRVTADEITNRRTKAPADSELRDDDPDLAGNQEGAS